jgi:hypothetical protein
LIIVRRPGIEPDCRGRPFTAAMAHQRACDACAGNEKSRLGSLRAAPSNQRELLGYRVGHPSCFPSRDSVQSDREYVLWTVLGAKLRSPAIGHTTAPAERPLRKIAADGWNVIAVSKVNLGDLVVNQFS